MNVTLGVEEFQGLYGPYQVSELVLQKIWLKGAFDVSRLRDSRGRAVKVVSPGQWNRLAGPDFKGAVLEIGGEPVEGDVELHFSVGDWISHGHQENPNFNRVVLHVVYHPLGAEQRDVQTASGRRVPSVSLMDLLWYDLEEYASEDSIIESTGSAREEAVESLLELTVPQRRERLTAAAMERWNVKRDFARLRIERLGWSEACHVTAFEIMGYAANRIPMLHVAGRFPAPRFQSEAPSLSRLWQAGDGFWTTSGVRPANHPKLRLEQVSNWLSARPDWAAALRSAAPELPSGSICDGTTDQYRKANQLGSIQKTLSRNVASDQISGSKWDTLVCDGFLPLLAAHENADFSGLWFHWFAGNAPESLSRKLRGLEILERGRFPLCNGWVQGWLRIQQQRS